MANQTFVDFNLRTQLLSGDYIVGYKEDVSSEFKTTVGNLFERVGVQINNNTNNLTVVGNISATGSNVFENNSNAAALRITQTGTGNALEIEDSTNPDATPFIVDQTGTLVIGASAGLGTSGTNQRAALFVSNTAGGKNTIEFRNHQGSSFGPTLRFTKTRTSNSNDFSTFGPLSALDIIGNINFRGNNSSVGSFGMQNLYNTESNQQPQGSRAIFQTLSGGVLSNTLVLTENKVGVGTLTPDQTLTVQGGISASETIQTPSINTANFTQYKNVAINPVVKNSSYSVLSADIATETGYWDAQATYALQGGLMIKGHAKEYASPTNLPGWGGYGVYIQNVDNMDPGLTLACDGRANITHGMTFRAGNNNFTAGSDHTHVIWSGAPFNATQGWQMTMGGDWVTSSNVYNTNRFMVHTLPQYQINTTITATSGYLDTLVANYHPTSNAIITGVKLIVSTTETNNYNLIGVGDVLGFTVNPGLAGLVAVTYNCQVASISSNYSNLSAFNLNLYGVPNLLELQNRNYIPLNLRLRSQGGNPGIFKITSQIGTPGTQYVGLTGNYKNVPKHVLARFTTPSILAGLKTGSPLTVWIPEAMPSNSPTGQGFVTSSRNSAPNVNFRYGYFDAFVKSVEGADLVFSIGNLMDTYGFEHRTWSLSAAGNAGWVIYGGSQDTVHRPTHGTTGFYFEREPYFFNGTNFLSGGMVKNACLGTSESYGNFSYGLGFRGTVLGDKSATLAGDSSYVYGNNSVAIGGEGLVSSNNNQIVIGKYNNSNTDSLLVVGNGISDILRSNVFEIKTDGSLQVNSTALSSNGVDTFLKITNSNNVYGLKLQLL